MTTQGPSKHWFIAPAFPHFKSNWPHNLTYNFIWRRMDTLNSQPHKSQWCHYPMTYSSCARIRSVTSAVSDLCWFILMKELPQNIFLEEHKFNNFVKLVTMFSKVPKDCPVSSKLDNPTLIWNKKINFPFYQTFQLHPIVFITKWSLLNSDSGFIKRQIWSMPITANHLWIACLKEEDWGSAWHHHGQETYQILLVKICNLRGAEPQEDFSIWKSFLNYIVLLVENKIT